MTNQFLDAMMFRHACKAFDAQRKISDEDFKAILETGRLSPSSFGMEPWKFVVIQNEALREKIKTFTWGAQGQLPTASHYVIILARRKKDVIYGSDYVTHIFKDVKALPQDVFELYNGFYENFQKVDFDLLGNDRFLFDWSSKQTYIAMANMMTGAAFMGIDSCPIEGFDARQMENFLKDDLGIDTEAFGVSVMVAFGYRKEEPRPKARQPLEDVTAWYV